MTRIRPPRAACVGMEGRIKEGAEFIERRAAESSGLIFFIVQCGKAPGTEGRDPMLTGRMGYASVVV
jgi:hypothetical protein